MGRTVDYDQIAPTYDHRYARSAYTGVKRTLLDFAGECAGQRVLEVGCGTGHWLALLAQHGFPVSGLDASHEMLQRAKAQVPGAALARATAEQIPWKDGSFSRLVAINALHHFDGKDEFLVEARRVLEPNGALMSVGLDPHVGSDRWCIYDYFDSALETDRARYPSTGWIREAMSSAGFSRCETVVAEHIVQRLPASMAIEKGHLGQATTSQLGLLTDAAYERGLNRIQKDVEVAKERGQDLVLEADLRLYATIGRVS